MKQIQTREHTFLFIFLDDVEYIKTTLRNKIENHGKVNGKQSDKVRIHQTNKAQIQLPKDISLFPTKFKLIDT